MSSPGLSASVEPTAPGAPSGHNQTDLGESADHVAAGNANKERTNTSRYRSIFIRGFSRRPYYLWNEELPVLGMISAVLSMITSFGFRKLLLHTGQAPPDTPASHIMRVRKIMRSGIDRRRTIATAGRSAHPK